MKTKMLRVCAVAIALWVASLFTCAGAAYAVATVQTIKYNNVIQTSGGTYTATAAGTATFFYGATGTFSTLRGIGGDPPNDSFSVTIDGVEVYFFVASRNPTPAATSYTNAALALAPGTHTLFASTADANGTTVNTAVFTLTVLPPPAPQLSTSPGSLNLGSVSVGQTSAASSVTISNTGNATSAAVTGGASAPFTSGAASCSSGSSMSAILAGGSCAVPISFTPSAAGSASQTLNFTSNGASAGSVGLQGVGEPAPVVSISSPANGFSVNSGTSVTVVGSATQANGSITSLVLYDGATQLSSVAAASLSYSAVFALGSHSLTLKATNNLGASSVSAAVAVTITTLPAQLSASPTSLNLGSAVTGYATAAQNVVVSNTGGAASGPITGAPSAPFAATGTSCTSGSSMSSILASGSCTLSYMLTPNVVGTNSQSLALVSGGSTIATVSLSGTGTATSGVPVAIAAVVGHQSDPDAGTLPGELTVTPSGATAYEIPVIVPPGTGGLAPQISMGYNSQGVNGIMGLGWSLSAVSRITRCGKTIIQDPLVGVPGVAGINGRISFTTSDRLCLDGARLVLVNEGSVASDPASQDAAYWTAGSEYRTELDSFRRIHMITGPSGVLNASGGTVATIAFKVETRDGRVMTYGAGTGYQTVLNSDLFVATSYETLGAVDAGMQGIPVDTSKVGSAVSWALDSLTDASGNTMAYDYSLNATTGEHLLTQIRYGGNSVVGQTHDLAARFVYQTRPDSWTRYIDDVHQDQRSRLTNVQTYIGTAGTATDTTGTQVRNYTLAYQQSPSSGRSMLTSVTACATNATSGTVCFPATSFSWGAEPSTPAGAFVSQGIWATLPILTNVNPGSFVNYPGPIVGMNIDLFDFADFENTGRVDILEKRAGRPINAGTASNPVLYYNLGVPQPDGTLETSYRYFHNTGSGFSQYNYVISTGEAFVVMATADFNGDGAPDLLVFTANGPRVCLSPLASASALGSAGSTITFTCNPSYGAMGTNEAPYGIPLTIDAAGDGRAGIFGPIGFGITNGSATSPYCLQSFCGTTSTVPTSIVGLWQYPDQLLDPTHQFVAFDEMFDFSGSGKPNDLRWIQPYFQYYLLGEPNAKVPDPQWYNLTPQVLISAINLPGVPPLWDLTYTYPTYPTPPASAAAVPYQFGRPISMGGLTGDFNGSGYTGLFYDFLQAPVPPATWATPSLLQGTQCLSTGRHLDCTVRPNISGLSNYQSVLAVADFDGDGQPDILVASMTAPNGTYTGLQLCHLYGDSTSGTSDANMHCDAWTVPQSVLNAIYYSVTGGGNYVVADHVFVMDVLGTGRPQLVLYHSGTINSSNAWVEDGRWEVFAPTDLAPAGQALDRIYQVTNGVGATASVTYADGLTTGLVSRSGTAAPTYPQRLNVASGKFVSALSKSDGVSPNRTWTYQYQDSVVDLWGRGNLGFGRVTTLDQQRSIQTVKTYGQIWPYIGQTMSEVATTLSTGAVLSNTINTWQNIATNSTSPTIVWPYLQQQSVVRADLDGSALGQSTMTDAYDLFGNLTNSTVIQQDPSENQWTATTANSNIVNTVTTTVWHLGQIGQTQLTKTNPDTTTLTRTTAFTYDPATALPASVTVEPTTAAYTVSSINARDSYGNIKTTSQQWTDPVSSTSVSRLSVDQTWDSKGRYRVSVRNALAQQDGVMYDAATGMLLSHLSANGLSTFWTVDGFGKILTETRPDGTSSQHFYKQCVGSDCLSPGGQATTVSFTLDESGSSLIDTPTLSFADSAGHVLQTSFWHFSGALEVQDRSYDAFGRLWVVNRPRFTSEADAPIETHLYDFLDRPVSLQNPDGTSTTAYHGLQRVLVNNLSQQKTESRNAMGQLVNVLDSGNGTTSFTYEPFGNLATAKDPNLNVSNISYDRLGRRISLSDPDLGLRNYSVDPVGRIYSQNDPVMRAAGLSMSMGYDLLDRMVSRSEADLTGSWVFDAPSVVGGVQQTPAQIAIACAAAHSCGQLVEASSVIPSTGVKDYDKTEIYDSLGRFSSQVITMNAMTYTTGASYDTWGRPLLNTAQYGTNTAKTFGLRYNAYGQLYRVERQGAAVWMATAKDQLGNVTSASLGNGLSDAAQFNLLTSRLSSRQVTQGSVAQLQENYTAYDAIGNVLTRSEFWGNGGTQQGYIETLTYDNLNRLQTAQVTGGPLLTTTYDATGNLLTKTGVGTGAYVYPTQGAGSARPHAVQSVTGISGSFSYDPNGNMLSSPLGRTQTWTSFDMPLLFTQGANSSQFLYGPDHQRVKQIRSDGTTLWYAGSIEVEQTATQTKIKTYWPDGLGLDIDIGASTQVYWMHKDRLGSDVAVSDVNGVLQVQSAFDTWGLRRNLNGSAATTPIVETLDNKGFTGQEMLDSLALVHLNGRVYDPTVGKFLSGDPQVTDPNNGQNYNRYSYVLNNPTNLTDPTGYDWSEYVPVYGSITSYKESIEDGHFWAAAAYGGMAIFDGATLGLGSIVDAPLKAGLKAAIKAEVKHEAAAQMAKDGAEQAARATELAHSQATHVVSESGAKAEEQGAKAAENESAGSAKESAKNPGRTMKDGEGATAEEIRNSSGGPSAGKPVPSELRQKMLDEGKGKDGTWTCWRCGGKTDQASKIDIGHRNKPRSEGGNLHPDNLRCEGIACNRSAGNRGEVKPGSSCVEKGTCTNSLGSTEPPLGTEQTSSPSEAR